MEIGFEPDLTRLLAVSEAGLAWTKAIDQVHTTQAETDAAANAPDFVSWQDKLALNRQTQSEAVAGATLGAANAANVLAQANADAALAQAQAVAAAGYAALETDANAVSDFQMGLAISAACRHGAAQLIAGVKAPDVPWCSRAPPTFAVRPWEIVSGGDREAMRTPAAKTPASPRPPEEAAIRDCSAFPRCGRMATWSLSSEYIGRLRAVCHLGPAGCNCRAGVC